MPELHSHVLPVIDLKGGTVVRGIGGDRAQYRPIKSRFATSSHPADIALGLRSQFGFHDVYVADLNAINGAEPDWHSYEAIASAGHRSRAAPVASFQLGARVTPSTGTRSAMLSATNN